MFNMENIGKNIAELRKENNMTQLELADRMGISFQAVSNWERGNSMPDISKLPELADLFSVTVDQLLGEHSEIIESAINGDLKGYLENNSVTSEEICKIAPIFKPNQVDAILESDKDIDLCEIKNLLPFVSRSVVNELALKAANSGRYHDLNIVAPFVSKEQLIMIAEQEYDRNGLCHFDSIAPYLNRKYLNDLAQKAIQKDGIKAISNIAPFLDKNMLSEYVKELFMQRKQGGK